MSKIRRVIFSDSTISHDELSRYVDTQDLLLPGIRRGDLIRCFNDYSDLATVIIIDGVFEQEASITHKEILWLLEQGIQVIGLSSMGALRAYELRDYGMLGYGVVFQKFLDGEIDGDDEVAITYFPRATCYEQIIPMVNIRITLEKIDCQDEGLISLIRSIHFKERNWLKIRQVVSEDMYELLRTKYIDQKREDVLALFKLTQIDTVPLMPASNKNIFILRDLAYQLNGNTIDFIDNSLVILPRILPQRVNPFLEKIAKNIINYLGLDYKHLYKIIYILVDSFGFSYSEIRLKNIATRVRREQKLFLTSKFIAHIEKKGIKKNDLNSIFDGILKLEAFFLNENYLFKTV